MVKGGSTRSGREAVRRQSQCTANPKRMITSIVAVLGFNILFFSNPAHGTLLPTPSSPPNPPLDLPPPPPPFPPQHHTQERRQAPQAPTTVTLTSAAPTIPQNVPAGGLLFVTPAPTDALSYHKIYPSVPLTFAFTYTSLISTPASLTLEAFCSQNGNTYPVGPIGADGSVTNSIPGAATAVTWDPYAYAQQGGAVPFADATYTLRVHDERGMGVGASPGLLAPNANVRFALYSATPYTPLASWTCAGCNAANALQVRALMVALPMTAMLMLAGAWGVLGRAAGWRGAHY